MKLTKIVIFLSLITSFNQSAHAGQIPTPLVETDWLAKNRAEVVMLDVRKDVMSFTSKPLFDKDPEGGKKKLLKVGGHIPGSVLIDLVNIFQPREINGNIIGMMSPEKWVFEGIMQQAGINKDSAVVIITKGQKVVHTSMATRLYWQLKYYGHDNVSILNGGMAQWILDERELDFMPSKMRKGNWQATRERKEILATSKDVELAVSNSVQLVDNRMPSLYLGTWKVPVVHAKGHIPGAKSYPSDLMTSPGTPAKFLTIEQLRNLHKAMSIMPESETITYCNHGLMASGGWFIMSELLGNEKVKLYDGSMIQWTMEKRPVVDMKVE